MALDRVIEVLVPDDDDAVAWQPASLLQHLPGGVALIQIGAEQREVQAANIVPAGPSDVNDLTSLPHLGEPQLLNVLSTRFKNGMIYTACGPSLLAINPWRPLPLYTDEHLLRYKEVALGHEYSLQLPPHVFGVAATALLALRREASDQTIVVSGESGAGKSKSARLLLQALVGFAPSSVHVSTTGSPDTPAAHVGLGERLLLAMEVLEPFGSAQTRRNPQ